MVHIFYKVTQPQVQLMSLFFQPSGEDSRLGGESGCMVGGCVAGRDLGVASF